MIDYPCVEARWISSSIERTLSACCVLTHFCANSITVGGGSDDATDDGSISVVPVTGATVVGIGTHSSGDVGYPISSLKVAPRLLETGVSITNTKEL